MKTVIFDNNEKIKLNGNQYLYLSDGTCALHLYMSDLKEEYSFIKTWKDLMDCLAPATMELYNMGCSHKIMIR